MANVIKKSTLDLRIPTDSIRLVMPRKILLLNGFKLGEHVQILLVDEGIIISLLTKRLDEHFLSAEIDEQGLAVPPAWLISSFTGVPNTENFIRGGVKGARKYVEIYEQECGSFKDVNRVMDFGCGFNWCDKCLKWQEMLLRKISVLFM